MDHCRSSAIIPQAQSPTPLKMTTKIPQNIVISKLSPMDVLAKARLDSGVHVAVSPNMVIVPEISVTRGEGMQARTDGMYAWAEFSKWPSFHAIRSDHQCSIPLRPEWRSSRKFMAWKTDIMTSYKPELEDVLWMDLHEDDYSSNDPLDLKTGTIAPHIVKALRDTKKHVFSLTNLTSSKIFGEDRKVDMNDPTSWKNEDQALVFHLRSRVSASIMKLECYRDRRIDLLITFREAQRFLLELIGWVAYNAEVRAGLRNEPQDRPIHPYPIRGVFVWDPQALHTPHNAGIPVWLVCGVDHLSESATAVKEIELTRLDDYFAKEGWNETIFSVSHVRTFCRTKEERESQPQGSSPPSAADCMMLDIRDAEAPQWVSLHHSTVIQARLGTNGFVFATQAIPPTPASTANVTTATTARSSISVDSAVRYEPYPMPRKAKTVGELYPMIDYSLEISPLWGKVIDWLKGLKTARITSPTRADRLFPPPALVSKEKSGEFCAAWLALRPAWTSWLMKQKTDGFDREGWRTLLRQRKLSIPDGPQLASTNEKRQQERHQTLQKVMELLEDLKIKQRWTEDGESLWNGRVISATEYEALFASKHPTIHEIAYEITEISFRYDILLLDNHELRDLYTSIPTLALHRQTEFFKIFHGEALVDKDGIRSPDIWNSLSSTQRRSYTARLAAFIRVWPSWPREYVEAVENIPDVLLPRFELEFFKHYAFLFLNTFSRFPAVPCVRPASVALWYQEYRDRVEVFNVSH